ncbi:MAG: LysM peptidoglycan-binding domain-containing protein [Bacteroidales bacterium]|nr:LysM peptidoglycan-binding domain-containing protein [Bacteroidales bacterium]
MNLKKALLIVFLALSFSGLQVQAQDTIRRSAVTETIGGNQFYIHKVERGQTLYSIARAYEVKVADILQNNPGTDENIQPDDVIKIPFSSSQNENQGSKPIGMNHRRVAKGETLFSLAKEYNVTVEEIIAVNDDLTEGLKEGGFVKIPIFDRTQPALAGQQQQTTVQPEIKPASTVVASPDAASTTLTQDKDGKGYFEFQERNRETLYELAIRYRISIDSIYAINPGVSDKPVKGQIIKIPISSVERDYITHNVRHRITLNRLANDYKTEVDKILGINPYISRQLQPGQTVRIPLPPRKPDIIAEQEKPVISEEMIREELKQKIPNGDFCDQITEKGSFNIALMMPFFFNELDKSGEGFIKSFLFIQYYEGMLLALDSLRKKGFNANIYVFNVEEDIAQAKAVLLNPQIKEMHLIIGPFYNSSYRIVAEFALSNQIPIVNPLSNRNDFLTGNPYAIKVIPNEDRIFDAMAEYIYSKLSSAEVFIARHNSMRDEQIITKLRSALTRQLNPDEIHSPAPFYEIIYSRDSLNTFKKMASTSKENVVIVYTENKLYILDLMRKLNMLRENYKITVFGLPEWLEMEGLDYKHLNNLNTHVMTSEYVDFESDAVRNFVLKYREKYQAEPENYAFKGYDTGLFFFSALIKYGSHFTECLPYHDASTLFGNYQFLSTDGNGFENQEWKILRLNNYQYHQIRTSSRMRSNKP